MHIVVKVIRNLFFRHWQFILTLVSLSMITGIYLMLTVPRVYTARALLTIDSQNLPASLGESNPIILSQIIKRYTYLNRAMKEAGLFSGPEYEDMSEDEKIALMRDAVSVNVKNSPEDILITISSKGEHPGKIAKAVNYLTIYFIDEKIRTVTESLLEISHFIEKKLKVRADELSLVENALEEYRTDYKGELPEDLSANLKRLAALRRQLNKKQDMLRNKKLRRDQLNTQMRDIREDMGNYVPPPLPERKHPESEDALKLTQLKKEYARLTVRYTNRHPDVVKMKRKIAELETKVRKYAEKASETLASEKRHRLQLLEQYQSDKMTQLKAVETQHRQLQSEIRRNEDNIPSLSAQIHVCEKRIEETSKREQEMIDFKRAIEDIRKAYDPLLKKKINADMAVEEWQKSSRKKFRILEMASGSGKPVEPDIKLFFLSSLIIGLIAGLFIAILLEILVDWDPKPAHLKSRFRRGIGTLLNPLIVMTAIFLIAGFGFFALKGVAYLDNAIRDPGEVLLKGGDIQLIFEALIRNITGR